jgi:hypothetical protein
MLRLLAAGLKLPPHDEEPRMDDVDLRQPAIVRWSGSIEQFDRLSDAIHFVVRELSSDLRRTAEIATEAGSIGIEQIAWLHELRLAIPPYG